MERACARKSISADARWVLAARLCSTRLDLHALVDGFGARAHKVQPLNAIGIRRD